MNQQVAFWMAAYHRSMNERLCEAAALLDAVTLAADKGAFSGSILVTLNHIAVADIESEPVRTFWWPGHSRTPEWRYKETEVS